MPKDNITINISVPIRLVIVIHVLLSINVFSVFSIISLPALHNPSIQKVTKSQTYCSLYNFLVHGY
jgi:hypothetical protein